MEIEGIKGSVEVVIMAYLVVFKWIYGILGSVVVDIDGI